MIRLYNIINVLLLSAARFVFRKREACSDKHILIIRLDAIGDMILTSPLIHALRDCEPDAKITLVTNPLLESLYENCPYVDEIIYFDTRNLTSLRIITSTVMAIFWGYKHLKGRYSTVLLPRAGIDAHGALMLAITSRCKRIIAFSEKQTKEKAYANRHYDSFADICFTTNEMQHEVERNLDYLRKAGYMDVHLHEPEIWFNNEKQISDKIRSALPSSVDDSDKLIALGFSASKESKCWPLQGFREVIRRLSESSPSTRFVLVGGPEDIAKAAILEKDMPGVSNMTGKLSLIETASLIRICHMFVGNDSGPIHLAAAVGTPVIEIFNYPGDTERYMDTVPVSFAPRINNKIVLLPNMPLQLDTKQRTNIHPHCITQITVEQVLDSIKILSKQIRS